MLLFLWLAAAGPAPDAPRALSASAPAVAAPGLETPPSEIPVPDEEAPARNKHDFSLSAGALILLPAGNQTFFQKNVAVPEPFTPNSPVGSLGNGHGLPYTIANPLLGASYAYGFSQDQRWWLVGGIDLAVLGVLNDPGAPQAGSETLYVDISLGVRAYFIPGVLRPFAELGLRFGVLSDTSPYIDQTLKVFPGVYASIGGEWSITRSVGIFLAARYTFLFIYPFTQESALEPLAGVRFYF